MAFASALALAFCALALAFCALASDLALVSDLAFGASALALGASAFGLGASAIGLGASAFGAEARDLAICISIFFFNKASISILRSKANGSSSFTACAKSSLDFLNNEQSIVIKPITIIAKTKIISLLFI